MDICRNFLDISHGEVSSNLNVFKCTHCFQQYWLKITIFYIPHLFTGSLESDAVGISPVCLAQES